MSFTKRLRAILRQRCPRCLEGRVFSGIIAMNELCPRCGHKFQREPGYFLGAMYVSYLLATAVLLVITVLLYFLLLPTWELQYVAMVAAIPYLFMVPVMFRYSRIIWMHFDVSE